MQDLIRRTLERLRPLFAPGTGKRRRTPRHPCPHPHITAVRHPPTPPPPRLPLHRSPYGLVTLLNGADSVLVRPYLTDTDAAPDWEAPLQHHPSPALVLGPHLIGAQGVAA